MTHPALRDPDNEMNEKNECCGGGCCSPGVEVEDTVDGWTAVPYGLAAAGEVESVTSVVYDPRTARHPQSQRFHDILDECKALHDKKQQDYGRDSDPFANVRGSSDWGMDAWVGSMVRANDKIRRLQQYNKKGTLANEGVADAFMDLINYAAIAMVLWEEDQA